MTARVVNMRDGDCDVFIGRPSKWGNPFYISEHCTRELAVKRHADWIVKQPRLMAALHELQGKTLGCYCAPNACHGDILAKLANELPKEAGDTEGHGL